MIETANNSLGTTATINTDGGSRGNPGPAAYGYVVRFSDGSRAAASDYIGIATNNVAEYRALIEALKYARLMKQTKVVVLSDSKLLVEQMNGRWAVKDQNLLKLLCEAEILAEEIGDVEYKHIRREFNKEADEQVNIALDFHMKKGMYAESK